MKRETNAPHEASECTEVEQVHTIHMQELGINPKALSCYWHCHSHPDCIIVVDVLQSRAEAEVECRPEMPVARGPNRGHVCAGMPGCHESAH
jgi:hypothetical protein